MLSEQAWRMLVSSVVLLIAIVLGSYIFLSYRKRSKPFFSGYRLKDRILNTSEQALYINLCKALGDRFVVLSKVRIEDFVDVKKYKFSRQDWWSARSRIKSRHVDFLICDTASNKPLMAIELDGASHQDFSRMERDEFVNNLYRQIGLPIEHIKVGSNFEEEAMRIRDQIFSTQNTPNSTPTTKYDIL